MAVLAGLALTACSSSAVDGQADETAAVSALGSDARVAELLALDGKIDKPGPNCASTAFYASGLIDDYAYVTPQLLAGLQHMGVCVDVPAEERQRGHFILAYGEDFKVLQNLKHMAVLTSRDEAFSKMGYLTDSASRAVKKNSLKDNVGRHLGPDCLGTLENSALQEECPYTAAAAYVRCDSASLRAALEALPLFAKLTELRREILRAQATELPGCRRSKAGCDPSSPNC